MKVFDDFPGLLEASKRAEKAVDVLRSAIEQTRPPREGERWAVLAGALARPIASAQREVVGEILAKDNSEGGVLEAVGNTLGFGDMLAKKHLTVVQGQSDTESVACHAGCHWCCYLRVDVQAPEVLFLAEYIRRMPPKDWARIAEKANAQGKDARVLSREAKPKNRIPCPVLDEGKCTAYLARPLACRGWTSMDAESCRRALDEDEEAMTLVSLLEIFTSLGVGCGQGFHDAGFQSDVLELTTALDIALNEPDAFSRWTKGEPVFARARVSN